MLRTLLSSKLVFVLLLFMIVNLVLNTVFSWFIGFGVLAVYKTIGESAAEIMLHVFPRLPIAVLLAFLIFAPGKPEMPP